MMNPMLENSTDSPESNTTSDTLDHDTFMVNSMPQLHRHFARSDEEASASSDVSDNGAATGSYNFFEGAEKRLVLYFASTSGSNAAGTTATNTVNTATDSAAAAAAATSIVSDVDSINCGISDTVSGGGGGGGVGSSNGNTGSGPDLRKISRVSWENMLNLVNCRILNIITNEHVDAYLLSESSMFVTKNRLIIKTCGSTTLLHCLEPILQLITKVGFDLIEDVFYSHKNLLVPSLQMHPHHSFLKESEYLDKVFNGFSHLFGHVNADRFYLYTLDNLSGTGASHKYSMSINENEHFKFEMIMEELDEKVLNHFIRPQHCPNITAAEVTRKSGIDTLIPGMIIDDYLFTPCGYSMNGLLGKHYMTIHITPESEFSYVSVETDVPQQSYSQFVRKLIQVFKPGKFMLNLFVPSVWAVKERQHQQQQQQQQQTQLSAPVSGHKTKMSGATGDKKGTTTSTNGSAVTNLHGLMLYEELLCAGGFTDDYRRCDFQMVQYKHSDIIYARYVSEGIS